MELLSNKKLKANVGGVGRLVQQLWQTKIYVKEGKAGNQGKKNQNKCELTKNISRNISQTYGERVRELKTVFPVQCVSHSLIHCGCKEN